MMEDNAFVTDQTEEVIDLVDIVTVDAAPENGAEHVAEPAEVVLADSPGTGMPDEEAAAEPDEAIPDGSVDGAASGPDDMVPPAEETFDSIDGGKLTLPAILPSDGPVHSDPCEEAFLQRQDALEERYASAVRQLEERLAASEKARLSLEETVESLQQQLAECSSMFLNDASVRLSVEEMVSRMVDARFSEMAADRDMENGQGTPSAGDAEGLLALIRGLEARMDEWESRSGQMAAASAARVIREEIAAMRAEAARNLR